MNGYFQKVALYLDIFLGGLIFRDPDVTISGQCGKELRKPNPRLWARMLGAVLNWISPGHTTAAIQHDIERAQQAIKDLS